MIFLVAPFGRFAATSPARGGKKSQQRCAPLPRWGGRCPGGGGGKLSISENGKNQCARTPRPDKPVICAKTSPLRSINSGHVSDGARLEASDFAASTQLAHSSSTLPVLKQSLSSKLMGQRTALKRNAQAKSRGVSGCTNRAGSFFVPETPRSTIISTAFSKPFGSLWKNLEPEAPSALRAPPPRSGEESEPQDRVWTSSPVHGGGARQGGGGTFA